MDASIPIVVIAYNRPKAVERLLKSLLRAEYVGKVDLFISVDGERGGREDGKTVGGEEVRRIASDYLWPFGEKKLIIHQENLGLRKHVLSCGDISKDYDGIIVLEDDLYVSPSFYVYILQAFEFYKDNPKIAGISLYSHAYNETAQFPFAPLADNSDVFFMQYASSWGQFWSRNNWSDFRRWYDQNEGPGSLDNLPPNTHLWPESSWKKYFISYMIRKVLFFVFPKISLTTNFADEGTHHRVSEELLQVPLLLEKKPFRFKIFSESNALYDAYGEITTESLKRLCPSLEEFDFEVDLYGMKSKEDTEHEMFISSRKCKEPLRTFGREMKPHEMNIIAGIPGDYFSLGIKEDFEEKIYFVRLLKCHVKKELAYWYTIREYHFYRNRLLTINDSSKLNPGFLSRKFIVMLNYAFRYFRKR